MGTLRHSLADNHNGHSRLGGAIFVAFFLPFVKLLLVLSLATSCASTSSTLPLWWQNQSRKDSSDIHLFSEGTGPTADAAWVEVAQDLLEKASPILGVDALGRWKVVLVATRRVEEIGLRVLRTHTESDQGLVTMYCEVSISRAKCQANEMFDLTGYEKAEAECLGLYNEGRELLRRQEDTRAFAKFANALVISHQRKIAASPISEEEIKARMLDIVERLEINISKLDKERLEGSVKVVRRVGAVTFAVNEAIVNATITDQWGPKRAGKFLTKGSGEFKFINEAWNIDTHGLLTFRFNLDEELSLVGTSVSPEFASKLNTILEKKQKVFGINKKPPKYQKVVVVPFDYDADGNLVSQSVLYEKISEDLKSWGVSCQIRNDIRALFSHMDDVPSLEYLKETVLARCEDSPFVLIVMSGLNNRRVLPDSVAITLDVASEVINGQTQDQTFDFGTYPYLGTGATTSDALKNAYTTVGESLSEKVVGLLYK